MRRLPDSGSRRSRISATCLVLLLSTACGRGTRELAGEVHADGSSTVFPLTTAVAEGFTKTHRDVKVTVDISGTTGGFEKFCRGEIDLQNASRPINNAERQACAAAGVAFVEIPVAHDGVTVVVNAQNDWATSMTVSELKKIWSPDTRPAITRWNQVRVGWPDEEIHLFAPGPASGTFDFFTESITGIARSSRTDYTASEDDTVIVKGVASDRYALGYVGYGYFEQHRSELGAVAIDDEDDSVGRGPIAASAENVRRGAYRPLSRTLVVYVNSASLTRAPVQSFVDFYLRHGEELVSVVGGIALSPRSYELIRNRVARRATGTVFVDAHVRISDLELLLSDAQ